MPFTFRDHLKRDGWIPTSSFHGNQAIARQIEHIEDGKRRRRGPTPLKQSVQDLKDLIEHDPDLYMGFTDMFKEAGRGSLVRDYEQMIELINDVISQPPIFRDFNGGAPGLSFNNILGAVILTPAGFNAFVNNDLNLAFQSILADWHTYLSGTKSAEDALTTDKWLSNESIFGLSLYLYDFNRKKPTTEAFKRAFVKDATLPQWGFKSWNEFFSRAFLPERLNEYRPMPKDDKEDFIISPADSRIYGIATNISAMDTFWLKGHRYSLKHLLNGYKNADGTSYKDYIGGTVYQAYLLPSDYHQWAMPFAGTIKKIITIPGTYFALSNALVDPAKDEFASLVEGLPYLSTVSTRKIAVIKADNAKIGTACFIPVGLQEISSVEFFPKEGDHLNKGDALGKFNFGGSTACMVFEPKVNIKWGPGASQMEHILLRSKIGEVY